MAAVLIAAIGAGKPLGHPIYFPIYEAASELGLPVILHRGGDAVPETPAGVAGGPPFTFAEYSALAPIALMSQVMSLITNGAFAVYPQLRVCVVGGGISWVPGLLRRMVLAWRAGRFEVPWIKESPEEWFYRHFRVSTYGIERHAAPGVLERLCRQNPRLAETICFGSGYPSWDAMRPDETATLLPEEWRDRIQHGNADGWFRWKASTPAATGAQR
jgi:predicted TIM-barrel fold metal-dependent hydrolase